MDTDGNKNHLSPDRWFFMPERRICDEERYADNYVHYTDRAV